MSLKTGDTIGIIALSGDCEREKIDKAKANLETLGFNIVLSKNIYDKNRYLAGSDGDKIEELHNFFINPDIKLILCARGGYGAIRLINDIDYNLIKNNPKPFCGFSDVTALLLMIYKKTGMITYHSPMACTDFADIELGKSQDIFTSPLAHTTSKDKKKYTQNVFFTAINGEKLNFEGTKIYKNGTAVGILWGGNLATVVSLCGQNFIPEEDFLFFAEDLSEPVYKIDKMFQQLINISQFKNNCKGLILGDFLNVDNEKWLEEYFCELSEKLNIPAVSGFKITHSKEKITIPIGNKAKLHNNILIIY